MSRKRLGFIGAGIMGGGMIRRLLADGFAVAVYNRDRGKAAPLAAAGARIAATPAEAASGAEIVFSMVADDPASRTVWLGAEGALASAAPAAVLVECSTLSVAWVNELAQAVAGRGLELVDAPVTGSRDAAAAGELNFLVGGSAAAVAAIQPALAVMGRSLTHLGPTGSGALVKLVNNFMAGVQVVACAEALAWLERTDIDRAKAMGALMAGAAASPVVKTVAARMTAPDFTPHFLLRLMAKDLGYAQAEAGAGGIALATAAAALGQFQAAMAAGHADEDMAAVVRPLRDAKA